LPPLKTFSRNEVIDAAFALVREEGLRALSARKVADRLKTSTSPIYGLFQSMEKLKQETVIRAMLLLRTYQKMRRTGEPFFDMGLGYIDFARKEKRLFSEVLAGADCSDLSLDKQFGTDLLPVMMTDPDLSGFDESQLRDLLLKMWIMVHGLASLLNSGNLQEMSDETISIILHEVGEAVIKNIQNKTQK
jgi:AcrR family transcriptional regulator